MARKRSTKKKLSDFELPFKVEYISEAQMAANQEYWAESLRRATDLEHRRAFDSFMRQVESARFRRDVEETLGSKKRKKRR